MSIGKRLPQAVYLHAEAVLLLPVKLQRIIASAETRVPGDWNVLKLAGDAGKVSFLNYPRFFDDAFPALASAVVVDLATGAVSARSYEGPNPPILHRKEALLPPSHPAIACAREVTRTAERLGLFESTRDIGTRAGWETRLARVGLRVDGAQLVGDPSTDPEIHRHRTALTRYALSTPMQALWRHGFLDATRSVFDYGCGRGDDVRTLRAWGLNVSGWDPHFAAETPRCPADVVNLGFVLNVIEDLEERRDALEGAWGLARHVLAVAVLIGGRSAFERARLFRDGVLTGRGTFQKYFAPAELSEYLKSHLGRDPVTLAPGVAFVFRDDEGEQAFLARRVASRPPAAPRSAQRSEREPTVPRSRPARSTARSRWEAHAPLIERFWQCCLTLGRAPEPDEFAEHAELKAAVGTPSRILRTLVQQRGSLELDRGRENRRGDILVLLGLNLFERRRSFGALPEAVRRDIRLLLTSYASAQAEAERLLFSAGDEDVIRSACRIAADAGLGYLDRNHSLQLHTSLAGELPPVLRIYLGCAGRLYGDVDGADLVKIHIQSGKLTLLMYDAFDATPLPELVERVKVNLRRQEIEFYNYGTSAGTPTQLLFWKSRYIGAAHEHYAEQLAFDEQLSALKQLDLSGFGPTKDELTCLLSRAGRRIEGFELIDTPPDQCVHPPR